MIGPWAQRGSPQAVGQLQGRPLGLASGTDLLLTFRAAVWVREGRRGGADVEARRGAASAVHLRGVAGVEVVGRRVGVTWSEDIRWGRASGEDAKRW